MSEDSSSPVNSESDDENLEKLIETHLEKVNEYDEMDNTEKIKNIQLYNDLMKSVAVYEEELNSYKEKLNDAEATKKNKKTILTSKGYTNAMKSIMDIKIKIDTKEVESVDGLLQLYSTLKELQVKLIPYLEGKKMEIIKIE